MPKPALAQFAWVGATNNYNLGTNWSPPAGAPPVAAGQSAQFANTGSSSVVVTAPIAPDSWTFNNNAQAYTMTGAAVNFSTATGVVNNSASSVSIANILGGTGAVTQSGSATLTLSGVNTYSGGNNVTSGTLAVTGAGTLGATTNGVTVNGATANLNLGGTTQIQNGVVLLDNNGNIQSGTLSSSSTFDLRSGTVSAALAGTGGVAKTFSGTVTLSGVNTYTGTTDVSNGTLALSGAGTLGNTANLVRVQNSGVLDLGGTTQTQNGGITILPSGTIQNGTLSTSGTISATGGSSSAVLTGTGSLIKSGVGTTTLSAFNTYQGTTTIFGGTLAITSNAGITSNVINNATFLNDGAVTGTATNNTGGIFNNNASGTVSGLLTNTAGTTTNAGQLNGGASVSGGTVTNNNLISGTVGITGTGTVNNNLTITGAVNNAATFNNNVNGTVSGLLTNSTGTTTNNGQLNGGANVTGGTLANNLTIAGAVSNAATFNNNAGGTVSGLLTNTAGTTTNAGQLNGGAAVSGGTVTNNNLISGTVGITGTGVVNNNLTITGAVNNAGIFNNNPNGTVSGLLTNSAGTTTNAGQLNGGATVTGGTLNTNAATSVINGGLTNSAIVNARNQVNGVILNQGAGFFFVVGTLAGNNNTFTNNGTAQLQVTGGSFTGITTLTNNSTNATGINISAGNTLSANNVSNSLGSTIVNAGTLSSLTQTLSNAGTLNTNAATSIVNALGGAGLVNTGKVNAQNQVNGAVANNAGGVFNVVGALTGTSTFANASTAQLNVNVGSYTLTGLLTNSGAVNVANGASLTAPAGVTNNLGGTIVNSGTITDTLNNSGAVTNNAPAIYNADVNNLATGTIANAGTWNGNLLSNLNATANAINNTGTWNGAANNAGSVINSGTWTTAGTGFVNSGTLTTTNKINGVGGLTNTGTVDAAGQIVNGAIANNAGTFNVTGALLGNSTFGNAGGAVANIGAQSFSGVTTYTNAGTTNIGGGTVGATTAFNNSGTLMVTGSGSTLTTPSLVNTGTINLATATPGSSLNASTAAYSGNGSIVDAINLSQGVANRTVTLNTASTSGTGGTINFTQSGGGATGAFPIVNATGANLATFSASGLSNAGLVNYALVGPNGTGNPTNSWAVVGTPIPGAALSPLTSILASLSSIDAAFHQPGGQLVASPQTDQTGLIVGGPWVRASGGTTTISSIGSINVNPGVVTANSRVRENFTGVQAGADTGWLNIGATGINTHFGITGGQISANATDLLNAGNSVGFEVPFVGLYAVATKGALSVDLSVRHSWYEMAVTNMLAGLNRAPLNGQSDNINASIAYQVALPQNWFIEPTANISYTKSTFQNLLIPGGASATLQFNDVYSLLGRVGLRFGTSFQGGGFNWTPFGLVVALREFETSSGGAFIGGGNTFALSTDRVGTFYQASAGIAATALTNGLLGFVRGDYRFGDKLNGAAIVGGLRYTFGPSK